MRPNSKDQTNVPTDMRAELQSWNNGTGISLESWVGCEGNLKLAIGYASIFWPKFALVGEYIVAEGFSAQDITEFEQTCGGNRQSVEATLNHLHIADIQYHGDPEATVERVRYLMPILKEIYEAKLKWQFPDRPCVVELCYPNDEKDVIGYQMTFWQKKHARLE